MRLHDLCVMSALWYHENFRLGMAKFLHIYSIFLHVYIYKKLPFKKKKRKDTKIREKLWREKKKRIPKIKDSKNLRLEKS